MKDGIILIGKSSRDWDIYYKTDGMRHGEVYDANLALVVSEERYFDLIDKKIIPSDAVMQEKGSAA